MKVSNFCNSSKLLWFLILLYDTGVSVHDFNDDDRIEYHEELAWNQMNGYGDLLPAHYFQTERYDITYKYLQENMYSTTFGVSCLTATRMDMFHRLCKK